MIYEFECKNEDCEITDFDEVRTVAHMCDPAFCPKCKRQATRHIIPREPAQICVLNDDLVTTFLNKEGPQHFTRNQYKERCKQLDRRPDGLTSFTNR